MGHIPDASGVAQEKPDAEVQPPASLIMQAPPAQGQQIWPPAHAEPHWSAFTSGQPLHWRQPAPLVPELPDAPEDEPEPEVVPAPLLEVDPWGVPELAAALEPPWVAPPEELALALGAVVPPEEVAPLALEAVEAGPWLVEPLDPEALLLPEEPPLQPVTRSRPSTSANRGERMGTSGAGRRKAAGLAIQQRRLAAPRRECIPREAR